MWAKLFGALGTVLNLCLSFSPVTVWKHLHKPLRRVRFSSQFKATGAWGSLRELEGAGHIRVQSRNRRANACRVSPRVSRMPGKCPTRSLQGSLKSCEKTGSSQDLLFSGRRLRIPSKVVVLPWAFLTCRQWMWTCPEFCLTSDSDVMSCPSCLGCVRHSVPQFLKYTLLEWEEFRKLKRASCLGEFQPESSRHQTVLWVPLPWCGLSPTSLVSVFSHNSLSLLPLSSLIHKSLKFTQNLENFFL